MQTKFLKSVRIFLFCKETKKSLAQIPMQCEIVLKNEDDFLTIPLGVLASDQNGYLSFKDPNLANKNLSKIIIRPFGLFNQEGIDILKDLQKGNTDIFYFSIDQQTLSQIDKKNFPSVQLADLTDLALSPTLFNGSAINPRPKGNKCGCNDVDDNINNEGLEEPQDIPKEPTSIVGSNNNYCDFLLPNLRGEECTNIYNIEKSPDAKEIILEAPPMHAFKEQLEPLTVLEAEINKYKVCTELLGYALGDLVHSIPLAPCESVKIAITNNTVSLRNIRTENSSLSESLYNSTIFERSLRESFKSSINQTGVLLNANFEINEIPISAIFQFNNRKIKGQYMQDLIDKFQQVANAQKIFRSAIVSEATQTQQGNVQTRSLRNHNHCHTLTYLYYDINEYVKVTTKHLASKKALLIKYPLKTFDIKLAKCKRHLLLPNLLDSSLTDCFKTDCCSDTEGNQNPVTNCTKTNKVKLTIHVADEFNGGSASDLFLKLKFKNGTDLTTMVPKQGTGNDGSRYERDEECTVELSFSQVCISELDSFSLELKSNGSEGNIKLDKVRLDVWNLTNSNYSPIYNLNSTINIGRNDTWGPQSLLYTDPATQSSMGSSDVSDKDNCQCCEERLINHLNCNKVYYNKILWENEDADQRAIRFEEYLYNGKKLIDQIVNIPIAIQGQWVAFELSDAEWELVQDSSTLTEMFYAPTGSVFTESILGQCSSCEPINKEVYWNWKDSPCDCDAPNIDSAMLNTTLSNLALTPQNLSSLISQVAMPNMAISTVLGTLIGKAFENPNFLSASEMATLKELMKKLLDKA